ncbi:MAG: Arc family DNA-binding protein [Oscillospiraceae bacterium]|nr:Arc family DNA-binding protein [Oscillospiraceae bacterium]
MAGKTEYKNNWQKENVDRVNLTMPKGRKEIIKTHAEAHSESVNGFINRAIQETMERDNDVLGPSEGRREGSS